MIKKKTPPRRFVFVFFFGLLFLPVARSCSRHGKKEFHFDSDWSVHSFFVYMYVGGAPINEMCDYCVT